MFVLENNVWTFSQNWKTENFTAQDTEIQLTENFLHHQEEENVLRYN